MNDIIKQTDNLPIDAELDNDLAYIEEAASSLTSGGVHDPLKYKRGVWQLKKEDDKFVTVDAVQQFAVDIRSYRHGWIKWVDKKPVVRFVGRKIDRWPLPGRYRVPDAELAGTQEDLWQETHSITMRNLGAEGELNTNGKLYTYTTTSWGGRKALGRLMDAYVKHARANRDGKMPVVYLGSKRKDGAKGEVDVPLINISDWMEFGPGAEGPGRKLTTVPEITQFITDQSNQSESDESGDFSRDDYDDKVPF